MPDSVISSNVAVLASTEAPESTAYYQYWYKLPDGVMYHYSGGEQVPTSTGLNLEHDGGKIKITKLTIVNGLITELEYEV